MKYLNLKNSQDFRPTSLRLFLFGMFLSTSSVRSQYPKVNAVVYSYEITSNYDLMSTAKDISMSTDDEIYNDGPVTVEKEYRVSKKIRQSISVERSVGFSKLDSYGTSKSLEGSIGFSFLSASIKSTIGDAYRTDTTSTSSSGTRYAVEEEKEFSLSRKLVVNPCTDYKARSFVKIQENLPIHFDLYSRLKGLNRYGQDLSTYELRSNMPSEFQYIRDFDRTTIIVKSTETLHATFGITEKFEGKGTIIPECTTMATTSILRMEGQNEDFVSTELVGIVICGVILVIGLLCLAICILCRRQRQSETLSKTNVSTNPENSKTSQVNQNYTSPGILESGAFHTALSNFSSGHSRSMQQSFESAFQHSHASSADGSVNFSQSNITFQKPTFMEFPNWK